VAELRAIAHGLRPSNLDSGLASALHSLATTMPIPVHLDVCTEPMPDEIATTAYYVASEALANVVKHAQAEQIEVSVARDDGHVRVRISDNGCGGALPRPGSGLAGLVDRVAAAGGRLAVSDNRPRGTVVEAVLPCAP
jgi:signal transduction histidine kinase